MRAVLGRTRKKTFRIDPAAWDQGTFKLSATYIESLEEEMDKADLSVLVLTPNDVTRIRDEEVLTPRDNALLELGLFMGRLHRERCYMLYERDDKPKLPTDLLGVGAATYQKSDLAGLEKALSPACQKMLDPVSEIQEGQKPGSFVAQIEGQWWELIRAQAGAELSFFNIFPKDKYKTLHMEGDHFDGQGVLREDVLDDDGGLPKKQAAQVTDAQISSLRQAGPDWLPSPLCGMSLPLRR